MADEEHPADVEVDLNDDAPVISGQANGDAAAAAAPAISTTDATTKTTDAEAKSVLSPIEPRSPAAPSDTGFTPLVTVVGFHHARGPEVESWFGAEEGVDPALQNGWTLLPFMALSDGAHAYVGLFSSPVMHDPLDSTARLLTRYHMI